MFEKPSALRHISEILKKAEGKEPLFFLDYDGTLTPIVPHPKDACLSIESKNILESLGTKFFTAVVTGRGLKDIKTLVGLNNITYAASHGFQIESSQREFVYPDAIPYQEEIDKVFKYLCEKLVDIQGVVIENKVFSVAIHDRQVLEGLEFIKKTVEEAGEIFNKLKITHGKRVFEFRPNLDWHKGKATLWLIENSSKKAPIPFVIGDDITDEDAFLAVKDFGITISVQDKSKDTNAEYSLKDTTEVIEFLKLFLMPFEKID